MSIRVKKLKRSTNGKAIYGAEAISVSTVDTVTEETIKKYVEKQADELRSFKVWDEQNIAMEGSPLG